MRRMSLVSTQTSGGTEHFATVFVQLSAKTLPHVRRFVQGFVESNGRADADFVSRLVVAVHELMENAIKYATDATTTLEVKLDLRHHRHVVLITKNHATRESAARVAAQLQRLRSGDHQRVYQAMLEETATRQTESGLGLARIAVECAMSLRSEYDENGLLLIEAVSSVGGEGVDSSSGGAPP